MVKHREDPRVSSHSQFVGKGVSVAWTATGVFVSRSDNDMVKLRFTHDEWRAFMAGVRAEEFEVDPTVP